MKKKLDLNGLLSKYEGLSNTTNTPFYSPAKNLTNYKDHELEQDFYQSRHTAYQPTRDQVVTYSTQPLVGSFQMSKSECENFLMRIKDQLKNQQRQIQHCIDNAQKNIHERFQNNHEKIRKQILELLDRAFRENEKIITDQLKRLGNTQPQQFIQIHKEIAKIDEEVNRLLYGLKGVDYKRSIADTVVKDFQVMIKGVAQGIVGARESYENSLGEVEPDRTRIQCIRSDLAGLFKLSKRNASIAYGAITNVLGGGGGDTRQQGYQSQVQTVQPGDASTRQRKSFFNF